MGKKVLFVDDDYNILNLLENFLLMKGFEVATAENGYFALKKLEEFKPDIVLLDIMMPRLDGYEVCAKIRDLQDSRLSRTPIIVLSALNHINDVKKAIAAGANDYIVKPINLQVLFEKINRYVSIDTVLKKDNVDENLLTLEKLEKGLVLSIQGQIDQNTLDMLGRNINGLPKTDFFVLFFQNIIDVDSIPTVVLDELIKLYQSIGVKNKQMAVEQKDLYTLMETACVRSRIKLHHTLMEAYEEAKKP